MQQLDKRSVRKGRMYKRAAGKPNVTANVENMYVEAEAWQVVYMGRI